MVRNILIVEDNLDVAEALAILLEAEGYATTSAQNAASALDLLGVQSFSLALVDMNYSRDTSSGEEGLNLIREMKHATETPIIAMTAWGNVDLAVQALKCGASDFTEKPWTNARIISSIANAISLHEATAKNQGLSELQSADAGVGSYLIAESAAMRALLDDVKKIASTDASLLLLGENGVGKSLIARRIHDWSHRSRKPFINVNLGGLSPSLFESELFGHVKGAFTDAKATKLGRFELADNGTIFLDEIGNVPIAQQPKLLRVIETGELERVGSAQTITADVRIVSATNADLYDLSRSGLFRPDLLYRINTIQLTIPPLRERFEDIVPLARAFAQNAAQRYRRGDVKLASATEAALLTHPWPGNVRELHHTMERAVLLTEFRLIRPQDLRLHVTTPSLAADMVGLTLEEAEIALVRTAFDRTGGNLQQAADSLGITRQSLYRRLHRFGLRTKQPT